MQQEGHQEKKLRGEEVDISKALCSCFISVAVIKHPTNKGRQGFILLTVPGYSLSFQRGHRSGDL